jgi:hypothetical protein
VSQGDAWGADPSVRALREVFAALEEASAGLLARLGVDPLDPRLRPWRARARALFEAAWPRAMAQGLARRPQEAASLYLLALGRALAESKVALPPGNLPAQPALAGFIKEAAG